MLNFRLGLSGAQRTELDGELVEACRLRQEIGEQRKDLNTAWDLSGDICRAWALSAKDPKVGRAVGDPPFAQVRMTGSGVRVDFLGEDD